MQETIPQDTPPEETSFDVESVPADVQKLVCDWPMAAGFEDLAQTEQLLDEALKHLGHVLKLLPARYKDAEKARGFLAQFA